jgi:serine/threonine protein kinase
LIRSLTRKTRRLEKSRLVGTYSLVNCRKIFYFSYIKQLAGAIEHCHVQNIVHRDIKPENIMITDSETVKLIDFGLSKGAKKNNLH